MSIKIKQDKISNEKIKESICKIVQLPTALLQSLAAESSRVVKEINSILKDKVSCPECTETNHTKKRTDITNYICPPPDVCPPRCMISIERLVRPGEVRMIYFAIKNDGNVPKIYSVGVRPFLNLRGEEVSINASLNTTQISVQPGKSVAMEMRVAIPENMPAGTLQTDIVVIEKKHNQNICLTLIVENYDCAPVATPLDEQEIDTHFHRWYHHFYCTPGTNRISGTIYELPKKISTEGIKAGFKQS